MPLALISASALSPKPEVITMSAPFKAATILSILLRCFSPNMDSSRNGSVCTLPATVSFPSSISYRWNSRAWPKCWSTFLPSDEATATRYFVRPSI